MYMHFKFLVAFGERLTCLVLTYIARYIHSSKYVIPHLAYHLFGQKGKDKIKIRFYLTIQNGSVIFQEKKTRKRKKNDHRHLGFVYYSMCRTGCLIEKRNILDSFLKGLK